MAAKQRADECSKQTRDCNAKIARLEAMLKARRQPNSTPMDSEEARRNAIAHDALVDSIRAEILADEIAKLKELNDEELLLIRV